MSEKNAEKASAEVETTESEVEETEEVEEAEVDDDAADDETADKKDSDEDDEEVVSVKDFNAVKKALEAARADTKRVTKELRAELRSAKEALAKAQTEQSEETDSAKMVEEAEKKAARYRDIAIRKEAALSLREAGAKISTTRLLKLLDLNDVVIGDDGKVEGLKEAIEDLKDENPEFFASDQEEPVVTKKRPAKKVGSVDGGTKKAPEQKLTTAQKMAQAAGFRATS